MEKLFERVVTKKSHGIRLDRYLSISGAGISRNQIQNLIRQGKATVNDEIIKKTNYKVKEGDEIKMVFELPEKIEIEGEDIPLEIVWEDGDIAILYKPPGLVVHPARGHSKGTLVNALIYHYKALPSKEKIRPGIVHRLDKDTSGLMLVAKTERALSSLGEMMERREIKRKYHTFVWGSLPLHKGVIEAPIGRDPVDRKKRAVTIQQAKPSVTNYSIIERFPFATYLEVSLLTGRTHQIRVHLEHFGFPVIGDPVYGGREPRKILQIVHSKYHPYVHKILKLIKKQALHAHSISFENPFTGEKMNITYPEPENMIALYKFLSKTKKL